MKNKILVFLLVLMLVIPSQSLIATDRIQKGDTWLYKKGNSTYNETALNPFINDLEKKLVSVDTSRPSGLQLSKQYSDSALNLDYSIREGSGDLTLLQRSGIITGFNRDIQFSIKFDYSALNISDKFIGKLTAKEVSWGVDGNIENIFDESKTTEFKINIYLYFNNVTAIITQWFELNVSGDTMIVKFVHYSITYTHQYTSTDFIRFFFRFVREETTMARWNMDGYLNGSNFYLSSVANPLNLSYQEVREVFKYTFSNNSLVPTNITQLESINVTNSLGLSSVQDNWVSYNLVNTEINQSNALTIIMSILGGIIILTIAYIYARNSRNISRTARSNWMASLRRGVL